MYKLVLSLPFDITIVMRTEYSSEQDANEARNKLPTGFKVLPADQINGKTIIEIPIRQEKDK